MAQLPLNDVYRALQARLDGYRQSASSLVAAALVVVSVFDSAVFRQNTGELKRGFLLVAVATTFLVGYLVFAALMNIEVAFREMSDVIVKIERVAGYHEPAAAVPLPAKWNQPWTDFIVRWSKWILAVVLIIHVVYFLVLVKGATW